MTPSHRLPRMPLPQQRAHPLLLSLPLLLLLLPTFTVSPAAAADATPATATPVKIPLSGGLLHASGFYFPALVGGQNLTLQVDISYSSLIVPRKGCTGCRVGDRRYDPAASTTSSVVPCGDARCSSVVADVKPCAMDRCFKCGASGHCCTAGTDDCAFNVIYGDKSTGNGTLFRDHLQIGGAGGLSADVLLGAMHDESHNFELPYADGVLGLAFQKGACRPTCLAPVMDVVANATGLPDRFSMCLSRFGGTLVFGAFAPELAQAAYEFVDILPVQRDNRYIVPALPKWRVGSRDVSVPAVTSAMLSLGSSNIGVSKSTLLALIEHLMKHYCHIPGLCSMESWFRPLRCSAEAGAAVAQMPTLTIPLTNTVALTLNPEDYLLPFRVVDGKLHRCVAFVATASLAAKGVGVMLGSTVLRRYAAAFDRAGRRVGFALAKADQCGPTVGGEEGLAGPSALDGANHTLTANSPTVAAPNATSPAQALALAQAELCRAQQSCWKCARSANCSFGYVTNRCVPEHEATGQPYPFCSGAFCACFAVGRTGWYVGVVIGAAIVIGIAVIVLMVWRKRRRGNAYQMVDTFEEQDLETF